MPEALLPQDAVPGPVIVPVEQLMSTPLAPSDLTEILTAILRPPALVKGNASGGLPPGTEPSPSNADSVAAAHDLALLGKRLLLPTGLMKLEPPKPLSVINDDPLFKPRAAATILGLTADTLKKRRQRGQGPDYIQYGEDGPVRYEWSPLKRFRAQHTINLKKIRKAKRTVASQELTQRAQAAEEVNDSLAPTQMSTQTQRRTSKSRRAGVDTQNRITPRY